MQFDWSETLTFAIGVIFGAAVSAISQVVATKMTRERHSLDVRFEQYKGTFAKIRDSKDISEEVGRGIVVWNNGDFVEREI